jgi:cupin 2 domain-containing protein
MNLFVADPSPPPASERSEEIARCSGVVIERTISAGYASPPGFWYDQEADEWVAVLQGTGVLKFDDGSTRTLHAGDHLLIRAHQRHQIASTSVNPPCLWLAVHMQESS